MAKTAQEILGFQMPDVTKAQQTVLGLSAAEKRQFLTNAGTAVRSLSDTQLDPIVTNYFKNLGESVRDATFAQKELRRLTGVESGFAPGSKNQIDFQSQQFESALQNIQGFQKYLPQQAQVTAPVDFSKVDAPETVPTFGAKAPTTTSNDFAQAFKGQFGRSPTNDELISFVNQRSTKALPDILAGFNGAPAPATTAGVGGAAGTPNIPFGGNLTDVQKQGITNLVSSGRAFNETDAKNYAYAIGQGANYQQFVGKTGTQILGPTPPTSSSLTEKLGDVPDVTKADDLARNNEPVTGLFSTASPSTGAQLAKIATSTLTGLDSALFNLQAEKEGIAQKELATKEQEQATAQENLTDELLQNKASKALSDTLKKYDIDGKQKALTDIKLLIAQEQAKINLGKVEIGAEIAPLSFISRAQAELEARSAARIGALAASASVLQDDLDTALQMANLTVETLNQDRDDRIKAYEFLFNMADKGVIELKDEEKQAAEEEISILKEARQKTEENAKTISQLIIDNAYAATKSGVTLNDDPTLAAQKISNYLANNPSQPELQSIGSDLYQVSFNPATGKYSAQLVQAAPKKGSGGGASSEFAKNFFTDTQLAKGATAAGLSIQEFGNLPIDEANVFVNPSQEEQSDIQKSLNDFKQDMQFLFNQGLEKEEALTQLGVGSVEDLSGLEKTIFQEFYREPEKGLGTQGGFVDKFSKAVRGFFQK